MKKTILFLFLLCATFPVYSQTIADKLLQINEAKQNIRQSLETKGVDVSALPFVDYYLGIASITSGASVANSKVFSAVELIDDITGVGELIYLIYTITPLGFDASLDPSPAQWPVIYDMEISGDGSTIAVTHTAFNAFNGVATYRWSEANNRYEVTADHTADLSGKYGVGVGLSFDGSFLALCWAKTTSTTQNGVITFRWNDLNSRYEPTALPDVVTTTFHKYGCTLSSDGSYLAVIGADGLITYRWNEANNRYEATAAPDVDTTGIYLSMSGSGEHLAVSPTSAPYLITYRWNEANNRYEATAAPDVIPPSRAGTAISRDGSSMAARHRTSTGDYPYLITYRWNEANNRYEATAAPDVGSTYVDTFATIMPGFSSNGDLLVVPDRTGPPFVYTYSWSPSLNRYELQGGWLPSSDQPSGWSTFCSVADDGSRFAVIHAAAPTEATQKMFKTYLAREADTSYEGRAFPAPSSAIPPTAAALGWSLASGTVGDFIDMEAIWWTPALD